MEKYKGASDSTSALNGENNPNQRRGACYLVATPRGIVSSFQQELMREDRSEVKAHPQIQLKLVERDGERFARS